MGGTYLGDILRGQTLIALLVAGFSLGACNPPAQPAKSHGPPVAAPPSVKTTGYFCDDGRAVLAAYPTSDRAAITIGATTHQLAVAASASGARYVGGGLQWWTKGMDRGRLSILKAGEAVAADPGVNCSTLEAEVAPPEPGEQGGLADDRTPLSEAPFTPQSAQGAADAVQVYYALIGEGKVAETGRLRSDGKPEDLSAYSSYRALVGAPGDIEGAAGSLYVEVPVVIYGRLKSGPEYHRSGKATLRRVNNVDGATADQLRWRIAQIDLSGPRKP